MKSLFIMDPLEGINTFTDTTYVLMREAERREHEVYVATLPDLAVKNGRVVAHASRVSLAPGPDARPFFTVLARDEIALDSMNIIWQRKDPPFDRMYLHATQLLARVAPQVFILNHPRGLREANEKLYALNFPDCTPRTLVSCRASDIVAFLDEVGGQAVIKGLDRSGGVGVFLLRKDDLNRNALIESVTREGREYAMVQEYLPEIRNGDKRIILLDGEPVGAVLRKPRADDLRGNIHSGATTHACSISEAERDLCRHIVPRLRADGLWFVGLDIIGEKITEINVTSPTGFQEIARLTGVRLETRFVEFAEQRARELSFATS